jgi:hypothetical protein
MSRIFGDIRQNGYVVRDVEAALRHWTQMLGVGPFFYFETVPMQDYRYRGQAAEIEVSIALANSGPLQIELIQQRNDAPSSYRDFLAAGREGLQHVAYWTQQFDADTARLATLGYEPVQSGCVGGANGRFVYYATEAHPGTIVELSEVSGAKGRFFEHIAEVSRTWDGSQPIRRMGS